MTIFEAIALSNQAAARAAIKVGDSVLVAITSRQIPFHARLATVTATSAEYVTAGSFKFHRTGKQARERESATAHYAFYALTPEVEAAMAKDQTVQED